MVDAKPPTDLDADQVEVYREELRNRRGPMAALLARTEADSQGSANSPNTWPPWYVGPTWVPFTKSGAAHWASLHFA